MAAGSAWHDGDFVWCQPNGRPIGASADWDEWRALLRAAGVRQVNHDARHAAATLLLPQGVDQRVVMAILGNSQISMTSKDAHVLPEVMTDAAEGIGRACGARRGPNCNLNCNPPSDLRRRTIKMLVSGGGASGDRTRNLRIKRFESVTLRSACYRL